MSRLFQSISLLILLALAVLRPLVSESYDTASDVMTDALGGLSDPTPVVTLIFDALILLATVFLCVGRAMGSPPRRYRWTGIEWGMLLLVIAAGVSCIAAGNKRLAISAALDWLCCPIAALTLVQLLRGSCQRRLLLAAVIATACVQTYQCFDQYFVGHADTWAHYESVKEHFWAQQGVDLDSARVELFERRMHAREAQGFLPHSNIAGSYLVLCLLPALGIVLSRWPLSRSGWVAVTAALLATILIAGAVLLTKSLGAALTAAAALTLWLVLWRMRSWISARRLKLFVAGWLVVVAGGAAVVGHGSYHGTLPGASLAFRWEYWRASANLVAEHPWTGVGRENFGRHYLRYKSIESPEEIANPHNLFVQAASDFGLLGLAGLVAMLIGGSFVVCGLRRPRPASSGASQADALSASHAPSSRAAGFSPRGSSTSDVTRTPADVESERGKSSTRHVGWTVAWGVALLLVVTAGRAPLLGVSDPNFLYYSTVVTALIWLGGFTAFVRVGRDRLRTSDAVAMTATAVGLFAFLLHETINFALFVPATAYTFFVVLACVVSARFDNEGSERVASQPSTWRRWLPVGVSATVTVATVLLIVMPVVSSTRHLAEARSATILPADGPVEASPADRAFRAAASADPLDPTPHAERARWLMAVAGQVQSPDKAHQLAAAEVEAALLRDPFSAGLHRLKRAIFLERAQHDGSHEHFAHALEAAEAALALYPLSPAGLVTLGDTQLVAGEALDSPELLRAAIDSYQKAIELDDSRPTWETIRRFRKREIAGFQEQIARAKHLLREMP